VLLSGLASFAGGEKASFVLIVLNGNGRLLSLRMLPTDGFAGDTTGSLRANVSEFTTIPVQKGQFIGEVRVEEPAGLHSALAVRSARSRHVPFVLCRFVCGSLRLHVGGVL
jgi:hypothetical protein